MRHGIVVTEREPKRFAALARRAEDNGWDAVFSWETLFGFDPWVGLTAAAVGTERIRLGTMLTPIVKYKPWHLASLTLTLDELSGGRVILSVGLGAVTPGWTSYEADPGRRVRAELMTESLQIMRGLWQDPTAFTHDGIHHRVRPTEMFVPSPVRPRPVTTWCVGMAGARRSLSRAAHCDGLLPNYPGPPGHVGPWDPGLDGQAAVLREILGLRAELGLTGSYDVVAEHATPLPERSRAVEEAAALAEAGFTWFVDSVWDHHGAPDELARIQARIDAGPPLSPGG